MVLTLDVPPHVDEDRDALRVDLLDGPERALAQRIEAAETSGRHLDLVVRARARAAERRALGAHPAA